MPSSNTRYRYRIVAWLDLTSENEARAAAVHRTIVEGLSDRLRTRIIREIFSRGLLALQDGHLPWLEEEIPDDIRPQTPLIEGMLRHLERLATTPVPVERRYAKQSAGRGRGRPKGSGKKPDGETKDGTGRTEDAVSDDTSVSEDMPSSQTIAVPTPKDMPEYAVVPHTGSSGTPQAAATPQLADRRSYSGGRSAVGDSRRKPSHLPYRPLQVEIVKTGTRMAVLPEDRASTVSAVPPAIAPSPMETHAPVPVANQSSGQPVKLDVLLPSIRPKMTMW